MFQPVLPIVHGLVSLRRLDPDRDVDRVHAYQSREDVCRFIPYPPRSREQVAERLVTMAASRIDDEGGALLLGVDTADGLVGDVMLRLASVEHSCAEIGYVQNPEFAGRGYATEAARALLELAFDGYGLRRVIARLDARNDRSAALLRRIGMRQEAHLVRNELFKGEWTDELDFAILADEWRRART